jgi:hypothetical protein
MTIAIDPATLVISVTQDELTNVSGTLWSLDTDQFRKDVWDIQSSEAAIWQQPAFTHNTEVTFAGTTFARSIEFINGFSLTFENTGFAYTVRFDGSNNNCHDIDASILNTTPLVAYASTNSAGLITVVSGSGLSAGQDTKLSEIHQDAGLAAAAPVTVTENTPDESYDQTSTGITKEIRTSGADKTVTRQ